MYAMESGEVVNKHTEFIVGIQTLILGFSNKKKIYNKNSRNVMEV